MTSEQTTEYRIAIGVGSAEKLMDWCMACDRHTFDEEGRDVAARMFALAGLMPYATARQIRALAEGRLDYTHNDDDNSITIDDGGPLCGT
jgi:hypothetical protein